MLEKLCANEGIRVIRRDEGRKEARKGRRERVRERDVDEARGREQEAAAAATPRSPDHKRQDVSHSNLTRDCMEPGLVLRLLLPLLPLSLSLSLSHSLSVTWRECITLHR